MPATTYIWLMEGGRRPARDAFDTHVIASVLSLAIVEARMRGCPVAEGAGLSDATLRALLASYFPHSLPLVEHLGCRPRAAEPEDERCLRELLTRHTTRGTLFQAQLAALIACRAMRPNHLWQDLGLRRREELSLLMQRHFEPLARRNSQDMKWKKFLYRMICRDEGFRLCTAPTCAECDDFAACFGDESGESLLARARRDPAFPLWNPVLSGRDNRHSSDVSEK